MKLAPFPSECALRTPLCVPVFEPTTLIPVSWEGEAPRKLIWVRAEASGVPAIGNTATFDAAPEDEPQPTATMAVIAASTMSVDARRGDIAKPGRVPISPRAGSPGTCRDPHRAAPGRGRPRTAVSPRRSGASR